MYYQTFPKHFGTTIDYAFYDEPTLRWVEGGRSWTEEFNNEFKKKYGISPMIFYPALWFNIGKDTEAARNLLLGFRAELFASGFSGTIDKWCHDHHIQLTGHVDQEEIVNPVSTCRDLMKAFKYQDISAVNSTLLKTILDESGNKWDTRFEKECPVTGGNLTYIHKIQNGKNRWFFANSSDNNVDVPVILKGRLRLQIWNPQTGKISKCESTTESLDNIYFTRLQLKLNPVESLFIVSE